MVPPHLLRPCFGDQPAQIVWAYPTPPVEGQPAFRHQKMDVGMPLQIPSERVNDRHHPHTHVMLVARPLGQASRRGAHQQVQPHLSVERNDGPKLPRRRHDQMMIGHIEQFVEYTIGPAIGRQLAAAWAEAGLARVRHDFDLVTIGTLIDVAAECRRAARDDFANRFEHYGTDPLSVV